MNIWTKVSLLPKPQSGTEKQLMTTQMKTGETDDNRRESTQSYDVSVVGEERRGDSVKGEGTDSSMPHHSSILNSRHLSRKCDNNNTDSSLANQSVLVSH